MRRSLDFSCSRRAAASSGGFALLLVIVLLGLLVVMVVACAIQVRMEVALVARRQQIEQARRHALAGLSLALGQLQSAAGPDQRATTRAPIMGAVDPNKAQWTGVWSPGTASPLWLVSTAPGGTADPSDLSFVDPVILVGPASAEITGVAASDSDQVRCEAIPLTVPGGVYPGWTEASDPVVGRTAYWVGGEADKLSVLVRDERSVRLGTPATDPWPAMDLSALWGGFDVHAPSVQPLMDRVLAPGQLGYVDTTAFSTTRRKRNFHRVTMTAFGVISNPADGGLKRDQTVPEVNPYGEAESLRYDAIFFSTSPAAGTDPDLLPTARFAVVRPQGVVPDAGVLSGPRAAGHLLVAGAFNLNAVSEDAALQRERWRAVLTAARTVHFPGGMVRTLTDYELDSLASQLTALRFRAAYDDAGKPAQAPFRSVAQFARSGLLQSAIDAASINEGRTAASPDRVEQTDLLALLAPVLVIRSDTFIVRAYGEVRNPIRNERLGEAWCEAVVQRLPGYVDSSEEAWGPAQSVDNRNFGRRFVVTSFRWMTAADL